MRTIKARRVCRNELINLFTNAGFINGIELTDEEVMTTQNTLFWHGVVRNEKARSKPNYISYHFPAYEGKYNADTDDFLREIMVAIDVFSKRSFDSKENNDLLETLENIFRDNGFEVEFADEIYETETSLFHYPITIFKLY